MKIEVGQYFKSPFKGRYVQVQKVNDTEVCYDDVFFCFRKDIIKVTDTPEILMEVGDLVCTNGDNIPKCIEHKDKLKYYKGLKFMKYNSITKILTPNEDESVYTLQYSREEE